MQKQFTNSNWLKDLKQSLVLSDIQKEILIGTILGDGYLRLSRSGKAARLQICHTISSKHYVFWKYEMFNNWVFEEPKYQVINNSLRFTTISHPALLEYFEIFYVGGVKMIPKNINKVLKSNLSLAVWFMDDGNGRLYDYGLRIGTFAFGLEGNLLLQDCLKSNFGLKVTLRKDNVKGYYLYIPVKNGSASKFRNLIAPYILPSMKYKIERRSPVETYMEGIGKSI